MTRERDDVNELLNVAGQDVSDADNILENEDTQTHRRHYVRAVFAAIEGTTFSMKVDALDAMQDERELDIGTLALLREEAFSLDDRGRVTSIPMFIRIDRNIRFALAAYAHGITEDIDLDYSGSGWAALKSAITIRNRLVHPRSASDLAVSDKDLEEVREAYRWFTEAVLLTLLGVNVALKRESAQLKAKALELESALKERAKGNTDIQAPTES